jgi:hypothetical protein
VFVYRLFIVHTYTQFIHTLNSYIFITSYIVYLLWFCVCVGVCVGLVGVCVWSLVVGCAGVSLCVWAVGCVGLGWLRFSSSLCWVPLGTLAPRLGLSLWDCCLGGWQGPFFSLLSFFLFLCLFLFLSFSSLQNAHYIASRTLNPQAFGSSSIYAFT